MKQTQILSYAMKPESVNKLYKDMECFIRLFDFEPYEQVKTKLVNHMNTVFLHYMTSVIPLKKSQYIECETFDVIMNREVNIFLDDLLTKPNVLILAFKPFVDVEKYPNIKFVGVPDKGFTLEQMCDVAEYDYAMSKSVYFLIRLYSRLLKKTCYEVDILTESDLEKIFSKIKGSLLNYVMFDSLMGRQNALIEALSCSVMNKEKSKTPYSVINYTLIGDRTHGRYKTADEDALRADIQKHIDLLGIRGYV